MSHQTRCFIVATAVFAATAAIGQPIGNRPAQAQTGKARPAPANVKALDVKAQQVEDAFVRDLLGLAKSYEEAGLLQKSKAMLQAVEKINNQVPGVKQKIEQIDDELMSANESEFDVDTERGWNGPLARVAKDKPFRIQADGTYRLIANLTAGPDGFSATESVQDMAPGVPCGALTGMIVTVGGSKKPGIQSGKPFLIGAEKDVTPKEDGLLYLRVNVPPGSECKGKLKVRVSGHVVGP